MATHLNIVVVEDHDNLRDITVETLTAAGHQVTGVGSAEEFSELPAQASVDLMLIDLNLPGEDGISLARRVRLNQPDIGIIMLTARGKVSEKLQGYENGADIYLTKPTTMEELNAAVLALSRRLKSSQANGQWHLNRTQWLLTAPDGASLKLTAKEYVFVHRLAEAKGEVVTKARLSIELDGHDADLGFNRMDVLLSRLRKKGKEVLGCELPIKAVTALGFVLTAPCNLS